MSTPIATMDYELEHPEYHRESYPRLIPSGAQLNYSQAVSEDLRNEIAEALKLFPRSSTHQGELWACCWATLDQSACEALLVDALEEWRVEPNNKTSAQRVCELARSLRSGINLWLSRKTSSDADSSSKASTSTSTTSTASSAPPTLSTPDLSPPAICSTSAFNMSPSTVRSPPEFAVSPHGFPISPSAYALPLSTAFQTSPRASTSTSDHGSIHSRESSPARTPRPNDLVLKRDAETCVVTGGIVDVQICHIFPRSLKSAHNKQRVEKFWKMLYMFAGPDTTAKVRDYVFDDDEDAEQTSTAINRLENLISLSVDAHRQFDRGEFILEPIGDPLSRLGENEMLSDYSVRFSYLSKCPSAATHDKFHDPSMDTPVAARRLGHVQKMANGEEDLLGRRSGDTILLKTSNPSTMPLPHPDLLTLLAAISKLQKIAGRADIVDLDTEDDAESCDEKEMEIMEWAEKVGEANTCSTPVLK